MLWNKAKIEKLLNENDKAVERAITAIYDRQTQDEKATSDTRHNNGRGFRANHASKGSYYARWCLGGRRLTGHHLANARKIALHYTQQLADVANAKAVTPVVPTKTDFESQVVAYMKQTGEPRRNAEDVVKNVAAGKCPDGCCGGEEEELPRGPMPGTYAFTARLLAESGIMTGDEADAWKDMMKDGDV